MQHQKDIESLLSWFSVEKRKFPWRASKRDPYAVWISEIMLQQTRAEVVIDYYSRWMKRFPTIEILSKASEEEVIKMWEGLGYYSRARNILFSVKEIVIKRFKGKIPSNRNDLLEIKGMGKYTSAAIMAFAFQKPMIAVDGNVARVLSRYFGIYGDISKQKTKEMLENLGEKHFTHPSMFVIAEALIELGAMVCKKRAECCLCPLLKSCVAYKKELQEILPIKKVKTEVTLGKRVVFVMKVGDRFFVHKRGKKEVMADLYEFPYIETDADDLSSNKILKLCEESYGITPVKLEKLAPIIQTFTRYRYTLLPYLVEILNGPKSLIGELVTIDEARRLPFSSAHRKLLVSVFM